MRNSKLQLLQDRLMDDDGLFDMIETMVNDHCDDMEINRDDIEWVIDIEPRVPVSPQSAQCDWYGPGPVVACFPSGKVQQYPSLAKAKVMLMSRHYMYIVCTPLEAFKMYNSETAHWAKLWKISEDERLTMTPESLWQYLLDISKVIDPWTQAEQDAPESKKITKRQTAEGYVIDRKKAADYVGKNMGPKQAKIIAESLLLFEDDGKAVSDEDIHKLLREQYLKGILKTKQDVVRIFAYYRPSLIETGVLALRQ